jgi:uncharacterized membrane protein YccC
MTLPGIREWSFSIKTFAAAMLALWIAFWLDLDRPYWAMLTAYIVAQPLAGAMRSKSAYRFVGTIIGAIAALVLIPNLVDAPEILVAALALWVALCIYFAVLDRTPRAYLFMLAGYSAALIGFPSVQAPDAIWDIVLARVEEITIGIACTTLIGSVFFPVPLGPALMARIDGWIQNAAAWGLAALAGRPEDAAILHARQRVASDAIEIGLLASHLSYDTSNLHTATRPVMLLQQRIVLLLPVLSGVTDRIAALRDAKSLTAPFQALLDRIARWTAAGSAADLAEAERLRAEVKALEPPIDAEAGWSSILQSGLLVRLSELIDITHDIMALRRQIRAGHARVPHLAIPPTPLARGILHRDHTTALHSAGAVIVVIGLLSAFWIATAWPEGGIAVGLAAVACCFFAAQDDPVPNVIGFLTAAIIAIVIDAVYLFAVLPIVHDFEMLALVMAPVFLLLGAFAAMPTTAPVCGPIAFIAAAQLALTTSYSADFTSYVNGSAASIAGLMATALILRVVRSVGSDWVARRLLRVNRLAIAHAAETRHPHDRVTFVVRLLDRFGLVVPRLASCAEGAEGAAAKALADLRVGVNVVDLQRDGADLKGAARAAMDDLLDAIAAYYRDRAPRPAEPALLEAIDRAIGEATGSSIAAVRSVLLQLVGIRRAMFPEAAPYAIASGPAPPRMGRAA